MQGRNCLTAEISAEIGNSIRGNAELRISRPLRVSDVAPSRMAVVTRW